MFSARKGSTQPYRLSRDSPACAQPLPRIKPSSIIFPEGDQPLFRASSTCGQAAQSICITSKKSIPSRVIGRGSRGSIFFRACAVESSTKIAATCGGRAGRGQAPPKNEWSHTERANHRETGCTKKLISALSRNNLSQSGFPVVGLLPRFLGINRCRYLAPSFSYE